jgi:hypothetical protein
MEESPIIIAMNKKAPFFKFFLFLSVLLFILVFSVWAQETPEQTDQTVLPRKFRQLSLGMNLDDLKEALIKDDYFHFRGDRDVSFLPVREQSLVETTGSSFIKRAFFQLRDGSVFIMAFTLNTEIIDHYSVFNQFTDKYGEPTYLDPKISVWETDETRISIERPLTVKYIDKTVFNDIINESGLIESGQVQRRQGFINEF